MKTALSTSASAAAEVAKTNPFHNLRNCSCGGCDNESFHKLHERSCGGCENGPFHNLRNCSCDAQRAPPVEF